MTYREFQRRAADYMEHKAPALLRCPFCGQPAESRTMKDPAQIGCFNPACPIKPKASSTDSNLATRKWNTRSPA